MASSARLVQDPGPSVGVAAHTEELRAFFESRRVSFGTSNDLPPFVERLDADPSFSDETASMLRAIIYRERDGLSRLELMDLLAAAVGGTEVDNAARPEIRDAIRRLMAFVEGVFRTRWSPGASVSGGKPPVSREPEVAVEAEAPVRADAPVNADVPVKAKVEPGPSQAEPSAAVPAEAKPEPAGSVEAEVKPQPAPTEPQSSPAMSDLFYRAQMVANGSVAEALAEERRAQANPESEPTVKPAAEAAAAPQVVADEAEHHRRENAEWRVPFENFVPPAPERGSRLWLWMAAVCALLLAFSAGLIVHQKMLVPLRDANQPYEQPPAPEPEEQASGIKLTPPATGSAESTATIAPARRAAVPDRRAELAASDAPAEVAPQGKGTAVQPALKQPAAREPVDPSPSEVEPRYMAPARIGASPALMARHLIYAPPVEYPLMARMTHIQGVVTVEAVVGRNGQVIRAEAISGHRLLRGAAVREVYERRYRPYTLNDRPTDVATIVSVDFRLK